MNAAVLSVLVLSQFSRSRVDDADATSQCLWWKEATAIEFRQNETGDPSVAGDAEFSAVGASFRTWQTELAACGSLSLTEGARTNSRTIGYDEHSTSNQNIVLFRTKRCTDVAASSNPCWNDDTCGNTFDCWEHAQGAIAITSTSYNPSTGRILDSDIELNNPSFLFTTVDSPPCVPPVFNSACVATDVQNTVTHEVGHLLGLAHFAGAGSTMNARADSGEVSKRTLDNGSKRFVCDVYPKGGFSRLCVLNLPGALGKPAKTGCAAVPPSSLLLGLAWLAVSRRRR